MTATIEFTATPVVTRRLSHVPEMLAFDLYRFIHKGIRAEMFAAIAEAGSLDPSDPVARLALTERVQRLGHLLDSHAEHEDLHCQPAIERVAPHLAAVIVDVHPRLEARVEGLVALAEALDQADVADARAIVHALYLDLASFAGAYLEHQDFEERTVMPALAAALPFEELAAIEVAIVSSIPPQEMAEVLSIMLPAMNVDDRAEMLGGMQAGAPPEVFAGFCALAQSVLTDAAWTATAARLGLA